MIVRGEEDGALVVISQTDHSQMVGEFAAHWGNQRYAQPRPYESVVRAAIYHDYGWLSYETAPKLDSATGRPSNFMQAGPPLSSYGWIADWMNGIDRYSALLISMHRTGLWQRRYDVMRHPDGPNPRTLSPEITRFIEASENWQRQERQAVDQAALDVNYRLLQVWDLLGLYFCCAQPRPDFIDPVPLDYAAQGVRMTITPAGPNRVAFDPYPFDLRPLRVQVRARRLAALTYADDAELRKAYFQAPYQLLEFELT